MAWRNLWRHRRRTILTLSSIAFGTMLAVLFTGIGDSNWREMIDVAARLGGGHVTIQHPEYLDTPTLSRTIGQVARIREVALRDPDVDRVVTRISGQLMLATARQSYGALFIAFDPQAEDEATLSIIEALAEGEMFRSARDEGIILGKQLSENLDAPLGRKVIYTLTDKHGEIVRGVARVSGIIRTGAPSVDAGLCMLPIDSFREVLAYGPDESVQVAVFVDDQRRVGDVAARLGETIGTQISTLTWEQTQPDLAAFIAMKVAGARLMEGVIAILIAAGIFNTLFVSVMERIREFGIMMALGFSPGRLFGLVMFESLWLGVVGLAAAAVVTAGPYYYLNRHGIDISGQVGIEGGEIAGVAVPLVMRADIYLENLAVIVCAALLATLLSGIYPAWKAGHVVPVESIRLV
jgi:ABC-type lipoprotein release transport system permease subunit